ncbi:TPA: glycosyltransferase family 4 protein [Salmonella enterica]|nr:glycosyltransferase family 4 protein [Salmonella enterica]
MFSKEDEIVLFYLKEADGDVISSSKIVVKKLKITDFFQLHKYDIIHSHLFRADILNAFFSVFFRKVTISTIHSNILQDLSSYYNNKIKVRLFAKLWMFALNRLTVRVAVSNSLAKSYRTILKPCEYICNGISLERNYNSEKKIAKVPTRLGILSRLHPGKGIEDVFKLVEKNKEINIIIYGDGLLADKCKVYNEKYENFIYYGYSHDISSAFSNMDIFLMPSRHEGFGMTVLEALIHQVPVICYDLPIFREILGDGAYFYKNIDELHQRILFYQANYESIIDEQMTRLQFFDVEEMIRKYKQVYVQKKKDIK